LIFQARAKAELFEAARGMGIEVDKQWEGVD
jgi:hypothetical protein